MEFCSDASTDVWSDSLLLGLRSYKYRGIRSRWFQDCEFLFRNHNRTSSSRIARAKSQGFTVQTLNSEDLPTFAIRFWSQSLDGNLPMFSFNHWSWWDFLVLLGLGSYKFRAIRSHCIKHWSLFFRNHSSIARHPPRARLFLTGNMGCTISKVFPSFAENFLKGAKTGNSPELPQDVLMEISDKIFFKFFRSVRGQTNSIGPRWIKDAQ